ncbi:hypothetical protein ACHAXR_011473 [Thalassiosira sp. AJA248-18]
MMNSPLNNNNSPLNEEMTRLGLGLGLGSGSSSLNNAVAANVAANPLVARNTIDGALGTFLDNLTSDHHQYPIVPGEITVRQWIERFWPRFGDAAPTPGHLTSEMSSYIKSAILLALKLTEHLLGAENQTNPIPAASITSEKVLVRLKESSGGSQNLKCGVETVDSVMIKSSPGDKPEPGGGMSRLSALGMILYEVFSQDTISGQDALDVMTGSSNSVSVRRLSLDHDQPSKRRSSSQPGNFDFNGKYMSKLEFLGIPHSLSYLVKNLLDCSQGEFRGDFAYRSLSDVCTDLQLMFDDPSCFLDNLQVGSQPSFEIRTKFYGRKDDISRIENTYQQHISGGCGGIIVSGGAGVGKSSLVLELTKKLASQTNCYFVEAKFDKGHDANPLSTIGAVFNKLCDLFAQDANRSEFDAVAGALEALLGNQVSLIASALPSLTKLMHNCSNGVSNECIDPAASMQFLLKKLLDTLSQHRRITFFLDDLQWADPASLLLIASIISNTKESNRVYFACCYRDDDVQEGDPFTVWLSSLSMFPLEIIKLQNIGAGGVNELLSETLHLSPRITRPLASILHHKTGGNPLFVRQLMGSLRDQNYIFLKFSPPRWAWDFDKIVKLEISDDVVALLIKQLQRLHSDLQLALKVASCLGSCVEYSTFDIISEDLGVNLRSLLHQVVQNGFMVHVDETKIRFAHDKIQQAAYEMMPAQLKLKNHMRFGLAICSRAFNGSMENDDDLFFVAVNQINRGGPEVLADPEQKVMVAALNLKAGTRFIGLSDFSTALRLFQHGISFMDDNHCWTNQYSLSLDLHDAAVKTACSLNDSETVRRLSEKVLVRAKCFDDKMACLYAVVKSLRISCKYNDSRNVAYMMLQQLGEQLPRSSDDVGLAANIQEMKIILQSMSDESILNMQETNQKKRDIIVLNLYHDLNFLFQMTDTKRIPDVSLRMVQVTLANGLCCMSPLAFAQFAIVLVTNGDATLGYRLGTLGLRLLDKINAQRYTSAVIALVGTLVSWVAEPVQCIAESHTLGCQIGQRNGDIVSGNLNYLFYIQISFMSGQSLTMIRDKSRKFALELLQREQKFMLMGAVCFHHQAAALIGGMEFEDEESSKLPTWDEYTTLATTGPNKDFSLVFSSHQYMRSFLFKQYGNMPKDGLLDRILERNVPLRPIFFFGVFFEGLLSFHFARQKNDGHEYQRKGEAAIEFFGNWSKCSKWNFENKRQLLEAEKMHSSGYNHELAESLYEDAIRSSHEHKFIHEEAVASELAGMFFYGRGLQSKSLAFFRHAIKCYNEWGGLAVARRVENDIQGKFGFEQLGTTVDCLMESVLTTKDDSLKKRHKFN